MKRKLPETSIDAYKSLDPRDLNETYRQILYALDNIGEGTFEDISSFLKVDKSKVWKRLSELNKMELIYRPGNKKLLKSGKQGYTWMKGQPSKTDTQAAESNPYKKGVKNASDFANDLIKSTQQQLFP